MIEKDDVEKEIDNLSATAKNIANDLYPFYYACNLYNDYIQRVKVKVKKKDTLKLKQLTLGLTYFEKQRLKKLTWYTNL